VGWLASDVSYSFILFYLYNRAFCIAGGILGVNFIIYHIIGKIITGFPAAKKCGDLVKFLIYIFGSNLQRVFYRSLKYVGLSIWVHKKIVGPVAHVLRDFSLFNFSLLIDFSMQDYIGKKYRFIPFYSFLSLSNSTRVTVFTQIKNIESMITVTMFYEAAG
jgi:hypothetical protein